MEFTQEQVKRIMEIFNWIKENRPDSSISSNDFSNYQISEIFEEVVEHFSYFEIGLCGCGMPDSTIDTIRDYLKIIKDTQGSRLDNRKAALKKVFDVEYITSDSLLQFMAYVLDHLGFTEHGSGIDGCWITDLGEMCLYAYDLYRSVNI